eukprot:gene2121-3062_t
MGEAQRGIRINGVAHVSLTVNDVAHSSSYWKPLLQFMGLTKVSDGDGFLYCVGGRTAVGLQPPVPVDKYYQLKGQRPELSGPLLTDRFNQTRVGLHHICWRLYSRADVDRLHEFVAGLPLGKVVSPPREGPWAPGYYHFVFEGMPLPMIRLLPCCHPFDETLDLQNALR